jgi:hypothetical protein
MRKRVIIIERPRGFLGVLRSEAMRVVRKTSRKWGHSWMPRPHGYAERDTTSALGATDGATPYGEDLSSDHLVWPDKPTLFDPWPQNLLL